MKRIIYFGDFAEKYSTERYICYAFSTLGYEILKIQDGSTIINNVESIIGEIKSYNPDFILFSKRGPIGKSEEMVNLLKEEGIKTVCWLFDLYFGLPGDRETKLRDKKCPFNSDILISTDGGHVEEFNKLGINHKCVRQGIHEPEAILYDRPKTNDIIFVGGDHFKNRGWLLDGLTSYYGPRFKKLGFPTQIRNLELNELYASTKVVVGDSQPSPNYWSNRIYETLGRGGFLIHPRVEGIEKEFEDKKHVVLYERGNMQELIKLIDYYLIHDKEREAIRKAGFEHVKNNYTYKHRVEELLKLI